MLSVMPSLIPMRLSMNVVMRVPRWLLLLCACTLLGSAEAAAQPSNDRALRQQAVEHGLLPAIVLTGHPRPSWSIPQRIARYKVPGLSLAVINDGKIEWAKGYGVRRAGTTDSVTVFTLFQAASISKPVAAAGALRLVQEGHLDLDEDVNSRLRSWKVPDNEHTVEEPVTLRRLLSHSAGVTVHGFPGYTKGETIPTLLEVLEGVQPANSAPIRVDTIPGSIYRYSGGGYEIVELLIEDVTNKPFDAVLHDLVLRPFGMERSTFKQPLPDAWAGNAAGGHRFDGAPVPGSWHIYPEQAAAGLWSTPTDLARFAIGLIKAFHGASQVVLDDDMAQLMLTRGVGDAGLGPGIHGQGDGLHFDHAGWTQGFRTYMVAYPYSGDGLVIMTNGDGGHDLIQEVRRAVARVYGWPDFAPEERAVVALDPSVLDAYAGRYHVRDHGFTITLQRDGDHLTALTPRGSSYTFYPETETAFVAVEDGSTLTITRDPNGPDVIRVWGMTAQRVSQP